jgi:hypothetical protein
MCRYLQKGPKRRVVMAFRGCGKSWLSAAFALWRLYRDPRERILVVSANEDRAVQFTTFCRRLIDEIPVLQHLRPGERDRDSVLSFDVGPAPAHQSPSIRAAGITGQITGGRASLILADDVEVPKNSLTQIMRDRLSESIKEFDAIIMPDSDLRAAGLERSEVVFLGTPQSEQSIYNQLPARGYAIRVWPSRVPTEKQAAGYGDRLDPEIRELVGKRSGAPTEPGRFTEEDLVERELSYGKAGFALQFQLDTTLSDVDKYPLKIRDLIVMSLQADLAPSRVIWSGGKEQRRIDLVNVGLAGDYWQGPMFYAKDDFQAYQGCIMAIDPSGRGKDETGYAIVAALNGYLYLLAWGGLKGGYSPETLKELAKLAKEWKAKEIVVEPNFGDGMFNQLLAPVMTSSGYPCTIRDTERSSAQKEARIVDTLEPVLSQHRLVINENGIQRDSENYNDHPLEHAFRYSMLYQLTRITRDKGALGKDDRIDALALAVHEWQVALDKDVSKVEQERKDALMKKEFESIIRHFKKSPTGNLPADLKGLQRNNGLRGMMRRSRLG